MRSFFRFSITACIIALLGILGYFYINSQSVILPDTPYIEVDRIRQGEINNNKKETLEQLLVQKKSALDKQRNLLEEKKALLDKRRLEIENNINYEAEKTRLKFQTQIDNYQTEIDNKYHEFKENREREYFEQILVKKELYEGKLTELVDNFQESYFHDLEKYKQELVKEYYLERVNYDLKLKFLDLSTEEEDEFKNRLTELENKQLIAVEGKESELIEEIENKIEQFKEEYNMEIKEYEKELKDKIERELNNKRVEKKQLLEDYLIFQQRLMNTEIEEKRKEILETSQKELSTLEALVKEISQEYFSLQSEVSILEKEVMY